MKIQIKKQGLKALLEKKGQIWLMVRVPSAAISAFKFAKLTPESLTILSPAVKLLSLAAEL